VLHETIATALLRSSAGRVAGVRIRSRNGRSADFHAPLTVGADGIRSTVARQVAAPLTHTGANASAFLYRYFDQLPAAGYEWASAIARRRDSSDQRRHVRLCRHQTSETALPTPRRG
jgi:2-polyprenyl-6-methoxyphenol hydroxylase-like FAD-dependent oxidoreductase